MTFRDDITNGVSRYTQALHRANSSHHTPHTPGFSPQSKRVTDLGFLFRALNAWEAAEPFEKIKNSYRSTVGVVCNAVTGVAGCIGGIAGGAAIGTIVGGPVGTVVGAIGGAAAGTAVGAVALPALKSAAVFTMVHLTTADLGKPMTTPVLFKSLKRTALIGGAALLATGAAYLGLKDNPEQRLADVPTPTEIQAARNEIPKVPTPEEIRAARSTVTPGTKASQPAEPKTEATGEKPKRKYVTPLQSSKNEQNGKGFSDKVMASRDTAKPSLKPGNSYVAQENANENNVQQTIRG